jgi:hypothetical protein
VISFTPRPLYPQGRTPGTHWIGGWVDPIAVLDAVVKRKIPTPCRESNLRTPIDQFAIIVIFFYFKTSPFTTVN